MLLLTDKYEKTYFHIKHFFIGRIMQNLADLIVQLPDLLRVLHYMIIHRSTKTTNKFFPCPTKKAHFELFIVYFSLHPTQQESINYYFRNPVLSFFFQKRRIGLMVLRFVTTRKVVIIIWHDQ